MGYRSDVKYVLLFKTAEHRTAFHLEARLIAADVDGGARLVDEDFMYHYDEHDSDYPYQIRVHHEDVKWYDSFEWVKLQDKLLNIVRDDYEGGYAYMRLGEDDDDVDTQGEGHGDSYVDYSSYIELRRSSDFV